MNLHPDIVAVRESVPTKYLLRGNIEIKWLVIDEDGSCWWQRSIGPDINFYPDTSDLFFRANEDSDPVETEGYAYAINLHTGDIHRRTMIYWGIETLIIPHSQWNKPCSGEFALEVLQ